MHNNMLIDSDARQISQRVLFIIAALFSLYFGWEVVDNTGQARSSNLFGINNVTRLVYVVILIFLISHYAYNSGVRFFKKASLAWLFVYILALVSIFVANWPNIGVTQIKSIYSVLEWLVFIAVAAVVVDCCERGWSQNVYYGVSYFVGVLCLLICANVLIISFVNPNIAYFPGPAPSLGGFLIHPNRISVLCALGMSAVFFNDVFKRKILIAAFFLIVAYLSGSRSGLILSIFSFACGMVFLFGKSTRVFIYVFGLIILVVASYYFYFLTSQSYNVTVNSRELNDLNGRDAVWQAAKFMIFERPIFGWGWYEGPARIGEFVSQRWWFARNAQNDVLNFVVASGVFTGGLVFMIYLTTLYRSFSSFMAARESYTFPSVFIIICAGLVEPVGASPSNVLGLIFIIFTVAIRQHKNLYRAG